MVVVMATMEADDRSVWMLLESKGSAAKPALKADVTATAAPANLGLDSSDIAVDIEP